MNPQSISMAAIGDFPLKKLSAEIARLLKVAPHFGDAVAEIVSEESIRRAQGRDSLVVLIPVAAVEERKAAANWARAVAGKFQQWAAEAPEFRDEFLAGADFPKKLEEANRQ